MTELAVPSGWSIVDGKLHRVVVLADFPAAFVFMTRVAFAAEKLNHHPDWSNSWNTVTIDIVSHDEGAITETCIALARAANAALGEAEA